jgi:hypothetical protein
VHRIVRARRRTGIIILAIGSGSVASIHRMRRPYLLMCGWDWLFPFNARFIPWVRGFLTTTLEPAWRLILRTIARIRGLERKRNNVSCAKHMRRVSAERGVRPGSHCSGMLRAYPRRMPTVKSASCANRFCTRHYLRGNRFALRRPICWRHSSTTGRTACQRLPSRTCMK